MDAKQNFYIAITILKEQGKTLKAIADFFSSENRQVEGMSESNISRAKPEWGPSSGTWKSAFTDKRLRVMITHLNEMLEYECRITWNEVGEYYENGGGAVSAPRQLVEGGNGRVVQEWLGIVFDGERFEQFGEVEAVFFGEGL